MNYFIRLSFVSLLFLLAGCNGATQETEATDNALTTSSDSTSTQAASTPPPVKEIVIERDTFVYYKVNEQRLSNEKLVVIHETKEDTTHLLYANQSSPIEFFFADSASFRIQIKDYQHLMRFHPNNFETSFLKRQEDETQEKDFKTMMSNTYLNIWAFPQEVYELEDRKYYRQFYGYPKQATNNLYEYVFDDSATIHMITAYDKGGNRNEYYLKPHWEALEKHGKVVVK